MTYTNKFFYFLYGLSLGCENILCFVLMCLLPAYFPAIAWLFFVLCMITTITRVTGGAHTLAELEKNNKTK
jgi:hypothetical protein